MRIGTVLLSISLSTLAEAASVSAFKCTDARGRISYQQQPCPPRQQSTQLRVEGEIEASRKAAADAIALANRPDPSRSPAPAVAPPAMTAMPTPKPKPVCPPTRENPGRIPVDGTDPWSVALARDYYQQLPSKTFLKNSGRWPKGIL